MKRILIGILTATCLFAIQGINSQGIDACNCTTPICPK